VCKQQDYPKWMGPSVCHNPIDGLYMVPPYQLQQRMNQIDLHLQLYYVLVVNPIINITFVEYIWQKKFPKDKKKGNPRNYARLPIYFFVLLL
jgi:hypothetical protein